MEDAIFVKLGGSLITEKDRPFTARTDVISRLARELKAAWDTFKGRLVLGHGSGSFGHVAAERSGLLTSEDADASAAVALSRTQQAVAALHRRVVTALREEGVPVFSFAPSSAFVTEGGEPTDVRVEPVRRALEFGVLPVTFGDVFLDRNDRTTICSTETVFRVLIEALAARGLATDRVLWFGDTEGVYDAQGETIGTLTPDRAEQLLGEVGAPSGTDVTGGMKHRLDVALTLARRGIPSLITSGLEAGRLRRTLRGARGRGTQVLPDANSSVA